MTDGVDPNNPKRLPDSTYNSQYPMNRVMVTESGHELHWDDTPGAERVRIAHMAGSYIEWSHDGRKVELVTDNSVRYVKGGETHTVDKNVDHKYNGSKRQSVSGHYHVETLGTHSTVIGQNEKHIVGMDSTKAVNGDHTFGITGKSLTTYGGAIKVKGDSTETKVIDGAASHQYGDTIDHYSKGKWTSKTDDKMAISSQGDMSHDTQGKMAHTSKGDMTHQAQGSYSAQSSQGMSLTSGAGMNIQAAGATTINFGGATTMTTGGLNIIGGGNLA